MAFQRGKQIKDRPVALGGIRGEVRHLHVASQRLCRQKKRGVAPIAFHRQRAGGVERSTAGHDEIRRFLSEYFHCPPGHGDIGAGFHLSGQANPAFSRNQGGGKQKPCDELAGNAAVDDVFSRPQTPGAADGIRRWAGEGAAHTFHFLPQRGEGTAGEPALQKECGVNAQSPGHGQQKPQSGAAVVAVQHGLLGDFLRRDDPVAGFGSGDVRAQSVQAAHGRFDVPVGFGAEKGGGRVGKGGADQQTVCLRF